MQESPRAFLRLLAIKSYYALLIEALFNYEHLSNKNILKRLLKSTDFRNLAPLRSVRGERNKELNV